MRNHLFGASEIVIAALCMLSVPAYAVDKSDATRGANAPASDRSDDIIVTARRREESLQDVPLSVQAFSAETLAERSVLQVSDLTRVVPGLTAQASPFGNAALTLAIRGQRQGLANIAYDPAVSVYADEVVQARSQGLNDSFFDLSNVQVLKGPQGTLFGRNTTGGALLVSSRAPTDSLEGYADITVGNYNLFRMEGAVNLPVASGVALRVAGVRSRRDGYMDNPTMGRAVDDQRTESWRVSLRIAPEGSSFENRLVLNGFHENDSGVAYKTVLVNTASATGRALVPDVQRYQSDPFHTTRAFVPKDGTRIKTFGMSNITSVGIGGVTLKNILGYRKVKSYIFFDLDGASPLVAQSEQNTREHQWSNETQLLGQSFDDRLDWVVGAYFFRESGTERQDVAILNATSPNNTITDYSIVSSTAAAYGQGSFRVSDSISLTGGLRYTSDKRDFETRSRFYSGVCRLVTADVGGVPKVPCIGEADVSFNKLTYTVSADWKFAPDSLIYLTHRFGYQGGGFTNSAQKPAEFAPYKPQTVSDWELGLKSVWNVDDLQGRTNIAIFRGNHDNIQRLLRLTINNPSGLPFPQNRILNAASAKVQGIEFDTTLRMSDWLEVSAAYTYVDAGYDEFIVNNNGVLVDYTGARFSGTPKHSINGSVRVRIPTPDSIGTVRAQIDGAYQSSTAAEDTVNWDPVAQAPNPRTNVAAFGTINGRLEIQDLAGSPLRLAFFVRNLTDNKYYTAGIDSFSSLGYVVRLTGAPRTFGVNASVKF